MDIRDRIARRYRAENGPQVIRDPEAVNPAAHVRDPVGRGPVLERLLDRLDPAFEGAVPPNTYVWGPKGAGKSALVTALFGELRRLEGGSRASIHTATRVDDAATVTFGYVDARHATTEFALRHAILDELVDEPVPKNGVSASRFRSLLADHVASSGRRAVVAVDHLGDPETPSLRAVAEFLDGVSGSVAWVGVGRTPPEELDPSPSETVAIDLAPPYLLADILSDRASAGLARGALDHESTRRVAEWADGDAHDALAAVFGAAVVADDAGENRIGPDALDAGIEGVPRPCTAVGRIRSLPANRQRVLRELFDLDAADRESVRAAAAGVAAADTVGLSATTVERILYELADSGIVRRVSTDRTDGLGRPPSGLEPCFPALVFRRLYDLASSTP
ncbi:Cdc6/Cdc18 family protein [Halococcus salsus]|uniref:Cdc6/Cdc18 family protein n=1 Tax=Halococcus salsus TaxID=2162894 RepID=UPI00135AF1BD|nr:ATP-binding protein [Halococcus salsus]